MKNKYISPSIFVVNINMEVALLNASDISSTSLTDNNKSDFSQDAKPFSNYLNQDEDDEYEFE